MKDYIAAPDPFLMLLLRVLGLDPGKTISFTLKCELDKALKVDVTQYVVRPPEVLTKELEAEVGHYRLERIPVEEVKSDAL